jgi:pyruvate/2-oxoglutarate dehydrogenase complex dihydrolipoamide dehydrogenase (E3) component
VRYVTTRELSAITEPNLCQRLSDKFVDHWDDTKLKGTLEKAGVAIVRGQGHLDGPRRVIVSSRNGGITLMANKEY